MRRILLATCCIALFGCTKAPMMRTGSICTPPVSISDYSTSDPVSITDSIVSRAAKIIDAEIKVQIDKNSELKHAENCTLADYVLTSKITTLNIRTDSELRLNPILPIFSASETSNVYTIIVLSNLSKRDGAIIATATADETRPNFTQAAKEAAEHTVQQIKAIQQPKFDLLSFIQAK